MTLGEFLKYVFLMVFRPRSLKTMEWRMLRLLNLDRKRHGLAPVRMQENLRKVARRHSEDMARKDYFDHVNLKAQSPSDRLKGARVSDVVSGENLAKVGGYKNPTQFAENGLMNSPGHRANILNSVYNVVGIGVVKNERGVYFFTQNFAKRALVFDGKIPKRVAIRKGLRLKGRTFSDAGTILCQVKRPKVDTVLHQKTFSVQGDKFSLRIPFKEVGIYEISLYADGEGGTGDFVLANRFTVKVGRFSWW